MTPSEARELLPEEFSEVSDETIQDLIDLIILACKHILTTYTTSESIAKEDTINFSS